MNESNETIKILLLNGNAGDGITSLINVFFGKSFNDIDGISTLNPYFLEGKFYYKNKYYNYTMWDSAGGQEKFRNRKKLMITDSKIILVVYSIESKSSLDIAKYWIKLVKEIKQYEKDNNYIIALIANKIDLYLYESQEVSSEEGENAAKEHGVVFFETSAKNNADSFKEFVNELIMNFIEKTDPFVTHAEKIAKIKAEKIAKFKAEKIAKIKADEFAKAKVK